MTIRNKLSWAFYGSHEYGSGENACHQQNRSCKGNCVKFGTSKRFWAIELQYFVKSVEKSRNPLSAVWTLDSSYERYFDINVTLKWPSSGSYSAETTVLLTAATVLKVLSSSRIYTIQVLKQWISFYIIGASFWTSMTAPAAWVFNLSNI